MEPVTHFLTGACIGRAGLNRKTAYATLAATLAAEAPDIDVVWSFLGPVTGLRHHRGITHTFVAAPFLAAAVTGLIWLLHRFVFSRGRKPDPQQVRWLWVWLTAFIAHLSHLLLDWTNNYGLRPFYPFNGHWYSGDLIFIAEPVLWGLLLAALLFPAIFGLADREVGARRNRFRGRGWAIFALCGMVLLWCFRWVQHTKARILVEAALVTPTPAKRIALEPYPTNPWRWHALLETDTTWQTAEVDTRTGAVESDPHVDSLYKPPMTPAIQAAKQSYLGKVYLDWSAWPVVRDFGKQAVPGFDPPPVAPGREWSAVEFSDLRFAYAYLDTGMAGSSNQQFDRAVTTSGLSGWVYIVDGREDAGEFIGRREQR